MPDTESLITAASLPVDRSGGQITYAAPPADKRNEAIAFLRDWQPKACVWLGAALQTTLLTEVEALQIPHFMADARAAELDTSRLPWRRMRVKNALRGFSRLLAVEEGDADGLKSAGARPWHVEVAGPLEAGAMALPHNEAERSFLAEALATRPVWYASDLPMGELSAALDAHTDALRRAHRFLLVISPADRAQAAEMARAARDEGFRVVRRSETDEVDPEDQIVIVDIRGERGLWYRIAPLTYLGGTLSGAPNRNPFEAAALGSAILHGRDIRHHSEIFDRLRRSGASRALEGAEDLSTALVALSTPDQSARLAHAAWDVSSRGAEVTDRVLSLLSKALRAA